MRRALLLLAAACSSAPAHSPAPLASTPSDAAPSPPDAPDTSLARAEPPPLVPEPRGVVTVTTSDECGMMFDSIYFPSGSAMPEAHQVPVLDGTAAMLVCMNKHGLVLELEVQGHADDREPDALTLSDSRASVVKSELVKRGVDPTWLKPQGYAAIQPRDKRKTAEARARNRRVDFLVLRNATP
jgi:outer membrane protein OmpA-like peptidoglycan-associated protein